VSQKPTTQKSTIMKIFFSILSALFFAITTVFAQAPQAFSYQAIANNANGTPVVNGSVKVRISILDNTATGAVLYTETHTKTTNAQGLFNLNIGQGTVTTGTFAGINWAVNSKFVKVELDPAGGTNYTTVGTSQLQSVPYALYADKVNPANVTNSISTTGQGKSTVIYTNSNAYAFYQYGTANSGNWLSQSINGTILGTASDTSAIVIYTNSDAYAFYQYGTANSGNWLSQPINGTIKGCVNSKNCIVLYTDTNAYAFYQYGTANSGNWLSQSLNGTPIGAIVTEKGIVIYTSAVAYSFYQYGTEIGFLNP
jgi:hypothetical protein